MTTCERCDGFGYLTAHGLPPSLREQKGNFYCVRTSTTPGSTPTERLCPECDGLGVHGLDPALPTQIRGGVEKVPILQARYAAGLPLWHPEDEGVVVPCDSPIFAPLPEPWQDWTVECLKAWREKSRKSSQPGLTPESDPSTT